VRAAASQSARESGRSVLFMAGRPSEHVKVRPALGQGELQYLLSATLVPRDKFLQLTGAQPSSDPDARSAASRNKYFVRNANSASLVAACTAALQKEPRDTFALLTRAGEYLKKGAGSAAAAAHTRASRAGA